MDLILAYIDRRKFVQKAIDRAKIRCESCKGRGYIIVFPEDNMFSYLSFSSDFSTVKCPACDGKCFIPAIEEKLTREERKEVIDMYVKYLKKCNKKSKCAVKVWDRKTNRGDPRYK